MLARSELSEAEIAIIEAMNAINCAFIDRMNRLRRSLALKVAKSKAKESTKEHYRLHAERARLIAERAANSQFLSLDAYAALTGLMDFLAQYREANTPHADVSGEMAAEVADELYALAARARTLLHIARAYPRDAVKRSRGIASDAAIIGRK